MSHYNHKPMLLLPLFLFLVLLTSIVCKSHANCNFPTYTKDGSTTTRNVYMQCNTSTIVFATLADWGIKGESESTDAIANHLMRKKNDIDFIFAGGDNFYFHGVTSIHDSQWNTTWRERFQVDELGLPWMVVLGNHDYKGNVSAQIEYGTSDQPDAKYWFMPDNYYSLNFDIAENGSSENTLPKLSMSFMDTQRFENDQENWLTGQLQNNTDGIKIVLGHSAIYSSGEHGDNIPGKGGQIDKVLRENDANIFIAGHDHNMEFLTRHRTHYFVVGGAGGKLRQEDVEGPITTSLARSRFFFTSFGYAIHTIDLEQRRMTTIFYFFTPEGHTNGTRQFKTKY